MKQLVARCGPLAVVVMVVLLCLAVLSLARGVLVFMYVERLSDIPDLWRVFPIGLRMDAIVVCGLLALPIILFFLLPDGVIRQRIVLSLFTAVVALLVHMELSTPAFIAEYDTRPDRIYYEYLRYPREVFSTLLKSYPLHLLTTAGIVALLSYGFHRFTAGLMRAAQPWPWQQRALCLPIVIVVLFIGVRSSFDHRPANMSTATFSHNHLANELAVSSTYSLLNAIYASIDDVGSGIYGNMDFDRALERIQRYQPDSMLPAKRAAPAGRPPNLVIVVMESIGAGFVGALGGLPLTPNLDRLSSEGTWFTQMYATGTRTVRGLEAIVTGFPPSAEQSVLKRPESQREFFTLASLLSQHGYRTEFIYGGDSNFDQMGRFFRQNGFQRIVEQKHFDDPTFVGTWGVSDEDLMERAHQTFLAHGDQPFFGLILTTSNHAPYEFPSGNIELHEQPAATRNNAVKYTDHAIGRLFELADNASYRDNTVFLVVADHDARVFGADLVPIERFRIPALLIGPGVPRREESRVASQIDLAPTLLGVMGIEAIHPMIGRDLFALSPDAPGRALMQYGETNAFLVGDTVIIHQPHDAALTYARRDGRLIPGARNEELEQDALAHLVWADQVYERRLYRLSKSVPATGAVPLVHGTSRALPLGRTSPE